MHSSSFAITHATRGIGILLSALVIACGGELTTARAPAVVEVQLDERGGEAWTFARTVSGTASGECETVELERGPFTLRAPVSNRRFSALVPLAPGENVVSASCADAPSPEARATFDVRLPDIPRAALSLSIAEDAIALDATESAPNGGTDAPLERFRWTADPNSPAPLFTIGGRPLDEARDDVVTLGTPAVDGQYTVWLTAIDARGNSDRAGVAFVVEDGEARAIDRTREPPAWMDEAVVYGVAPFLFGEPAFDAVRERLPKLAELGVTTLWLSPIFESPEGDYGYAVNDYFAVREGWGTTASFRAMVDRAHELGMKVVLDFVPNHTSSEHRYFVDAQAHGSASPYWDFYERDEDGEPTHYFDWEHLPNLDYDNPEVRRWMLEAFAYWTRELDVDGFRVDVAWGVIDRAPDFFTELRRELVRIEPDVLLLAEASGRDTRSYEAFDAAYDWTDEVGQWAWRDVFREGRADVAALSKALEESPSRVFRFLDNNDTGPRFHTRHGAPLERVASTLLFTLPGIPGLFTGQELGAAYEPYQRETPLVFTPNPERFAHYRALVQMRTDEEALRTGRFVPLEVSGSDVYAFARLPVDGGRPVVVVLGFGAEPTEARVRLTPEVAEHLRSLRPTPLVGGAPSVRRGELRVRLAPHDARVVAFD